MGWAKSKLKTYFYKCRIILCNALHPSHINNAPLSSRESSSRAQAPPVSYERVATSVSKVACIRGDKCDRAQALKETIENAAAAETNGAFSQGSGMIFQIILLLWTDLSSSAFCTKVETHTIRA